LQGLHAGGGTRTPDTRIMIAPRGPEHMASNHHAAQLLERVGWAVTDAKEAEDIGR
jgi:hypothetical protein